MKRLLRSKNDYKKTILRNQLTSLILFESISTLTRSAKNLISYANHFFVGVRKCDLSSKKLAHETLLDKNAIKKLFEEILPRYDKAETNYVRMLSLIPRKGDQADMSLVSLLKPLNIDKKSTEDKKADKSPKKNEPDKK